jgi:hypothetical protein
MGTLIQDLRFAFRQLGRAPSFAVTAVLTLALGIGANTAIFSLVNSLLLKPLPVAHPEQIAELALSQSNGPMLPALSWPEFKQIRAQSGSSFSDVMIHSLGLDGIATQGQQPQRILTSYVSGNFFSGLGLRPAAGRPVFAQRRPSAGPGPSDCSRLRLLEAEVQCRPKRGGSAGNRERASLHNRRRGAQRLPRRASLCLRQAAYLPLGEQIIEGQSPDFMNGWQNRQFPGLRTASSRRELEPGERGPGSGGAAVDPAAAGV